MDEMDTVESDTQIDADEEDALLKSDDDGNVDNENEDESNTSTSDDEEEEENEEQKLFINYMYILSIVEKDKYNYDNYTKLIEIAHQMDNLETIRKSYKLFSTVYPLAPEIWLKWLSIETSIATTPDQVLEVEKLFRKALKDYYCPLVALEFAKFAHKLPNSDMIWNEILRTYALHCMYGRKFFILWREYYNEKEDKTEIEKLEQIFKVYKDELQLPFNEMEESYIEFKVLYQKNKDKIQLNWDEIDEKYNEAKEQMIVMLPFEKQLEEQKLKVKCYQERAKLYKNYIMNVEDILNENYLQMIYERMVTECCLDEKCWIDYINYVENRNTKRKEEELVKIESEKNPIFSQSSYYLADRALRNCTWSHKIYILKMRLFEHNCATKQDIQSILEQAMEAGFQTPEPIVDIWLEYLACLRRLTDYTDENEVEILRNNFNFAWNSLGQQWGALADCNCEILQFWGKLEYGPLKDPSKGKQLWMTVMESSDNATKSALWMEYIQLEMKYNLNATRRLFQSALSHYNEMDNPDVLMSAWIQFERCNGSLKQLEFCEKESERILNQINIFTKKFDSMQSNKNEKSKNLKKNLNKIDDNVKESSAPSSSFHKTGKRVHQEDNDDSKLVLKKPKTSNSKKEDVFKEHENDEIDVSKDHLRIFLSNLDYNITEEDIRENLPEISIDNIDLVKSANGKGRGFGYVQLTSEDEVQKALKFDKRLIRGRPTYISSVLRDKEKRQKFKYSNELEPKKLFVKGIPYDATNDELKSIFEKYGKLKDVRIVHHKSGKSKGIAYIEYENENSASIAVLKLDQYDLRGFKLNVAISAPPPPKSNKKESGLNIMKLLGHQGGKKPAIRSEQKPRMNLIPTSVRKLAQSSAVTPSTATINGKNSTTATTVSKSNEDFRKELLSKK